MLWDPQALWLAGVQLPGARSHPQAPKRHRCRWRLPQQQFILKIQASWLHCYQWLPNSSRFPFAFPSSQKSWAHDNPCGDGLEVVALAKFTHEDGKLHRSCEISPFEGGQLIGTLIGHVPSVWRLGEFEDQPLSLDYRLEMMKKTPCTKCCSVHVFNQIIWLVYMSNSKSSEGIQNQTVFSRKTPGFSSSGLRTPHRLHIAQRLRSLLTLKELCIDIWNIWRNEMRWRWQVSFCRMVYILRCCWCIYFKQVYNTA